MKDTTQTIEAKPCLIIKPKKGWQLIDFKELWQYRDLLNILVNRDVKVRYRQTVLGFLWAIIQPLFMMIVFTLFFGNLAKLPSEGVPYPIFSYSALVAWTYFSNAVSNSSGALSKESVLISKVYFPRLIAPLTPIFTFLVDFVIAFIILIFMMLYYHIYPTIMAFFVPLLVIVMMLAASGVGMFLSALNAKYRDVGYTIPFLVQFWMFASPVIYPASVLSEKNQLIYAINPMTGVIEGFRSALLGSTAFPGKMLLISTAVSLIVFIIGALYFRQTERYFADVI